MITMHLIGEGQWLNVSIRGEGKNFGTSGLTNSLLLSGCAASIRSLNGVRSLGLTL